MDLMHRRGHTLPMRNAHASARRTPCTVPDVVRAARCAAAALLLATVAIAGSARAQSGTPTIISTALTATAGSATDQRGVRSSAATFTPSLTASRAGRFDVMVGGGLTRFAAGARSLGAFTGLGLARAVTSRARVSLAANASAARTSWGTRFESAEAVPSVEWSAGHVALFAGVRGAVGATTVETRSERTPTPPVLPLGSPPPAIAPGARTERQRLVRRGFAPLGGVQVRVADVMGRRTAVVAYRAEAMRIDRLAVFDHHATLVISARRVSAAAALGRRESVDERRSFASASLTLAATRALSVEVGGGSYPANRLNGTSAGSFLQAGATIRAGGARPRAMVAAPAPRGAPRAEAGMTRLAILASRAAVVTVAGDWNDWQPERTTRADNGVWYVDVRLPAGEYRYAFLVDGTWRVPAGAVQADDGFGGTSAFVTVREQRRGQDPNTQEYR